MCIFLGADWTKDNVPLRITNLSTVLTIEHTKKKEFQSDFLELLCINVAEYFTDGAHDPTGAQQECRTADRHVSGAR